MTPVKQTLLDYLSTPNPLINSRHSWTGSNTKSTSNGWCSYSHPPVEWKEFNFDTLSELNKDLLYQEFSEEDLPNFNQKLPYHMTEIRNENTLNSLLVRWNNAVVSAALAAAQSESLKKVGSRNGHEEEIFMACGCQAAIVPRFNKKKRVIPDWAGIVKDNVHEQLVDGPKTIRISHYNFLPGDTKLSSKWRSEDINKEKAEVKAPLNQVLTYCAEARVRYGYIITQEELVVLRITEKSRSPKPAKLKPRGGPPQEKQLGKQDFKHSLEYKSVPWEQERNAQSNELTVNLALWWLHLLAAQERSLKESYSELGAKDVAPGPRNRQFSSFSNRDGGQPDEDSGSKPSFSQFSSFNSKRSRDDDEDLVDVEMGGLDRNPRKRRGGARSHDASMSFGSQSSV